MASDTPEDPIERYAREIIARFNLGATGRTNPSPILPGDQGELKVSLETIGGNLLLVFGTQLQWIAMTPNEARAFAAALLTKARRAEEKEAEEKE